MRNILVIVLALAILFGGCNNNSQIAKRTEDNTKIDHVESESKTVEHNSSKVPNEINNLFDPKEVRVGSTVSDMEIISLDVYLDNPSEYGSYVKFKGETIISGVFTHVSKDDPVMGCEIAFYVDEDNISKLPKLSYDERYLWFVFSNHDEAEKFFGPSGSSGEATIVIDNYEIIYGETEFWNTATLVKVLKIEKN